MRDSKVKKQSFRIKQTSAINTQPLEITSSMKIEAEEMKYFTFV